MFSSQGHKIVLTEHPSAKIEILKCKIIFSVPLIEKI